MRYPNLRYGNPAELEYYTRGKSIQDTAKMLRRSERTVRDWLSGAQRVPWWAPEILRLRHMEFEDWRRRCGLDAVAGRLHLGTAGTVTAFPITHSRPMDFSQAVPVGIVSRPQLRPTEEKRAQAGEGVGSTRETAIESFQAAAAA